MSKIILYGGSFDPIHLGHLFIAQNSLKEIKADKLVFIPAYSPRWKEVESSASDRLNMLNLAIKDYPNFEINTVELDSKEEINYTYETIKKIINNNDEYFLLIGSDQLAKLDKWYEIEKLSKLVRIICYKRKNYDINEEIKNRYNVHILKSREFNQSSTELRNGTKLYAPKEVLNYIADNNLYYMKKLKMLLNEKRLKHSLSVAHLCYHIALNNNLDAYKAYLCGLLHDIGKYVSDEETIKIMNRYYKSYIDLPSYSYHQFIGKHLAYTMFDIKDRVVLDSIKYHCTGEAKLSPYAKILYASDKIDPLRGYDSQNMIKACLNEYKEGFRLVLKENIMYFIVKNIPYINRLTENCIRYYKPLKGNK